MELASYYKTVTYQCNAETCFTNSLYNPNVTNDSVEFSDELRFIAVYNSLWLAKCTGIFPIDILNSGVFPFASLLFAERNTNSSVSYQWNCAKFIKYYKNEFFFSLFFVKHLSCFIQ